MGMHCSVESRSRWQGVLELLVSAIMELMGLVYWPRSAYGRGASNMRGCSRAVWEPVLRLVTWKPDRRDRMSTGRQWIVAAIVVVAKKGARVDERRDLACRSWRSEHGVVVLLLWGLVGSVLAEPGVVTVVEAP